MESEEAERSAGWRRWLGPAGFLLALLGYAVLPVAGVSCDPDSGGAIHVCFTGSQLVTGGPSVDLSQVYAGSAQDTAELRDAVVNTIGLPWPVQVLAAVVGLVLLAGVVAGAVPAAGTRDRWLAAAGVGGVVLLVVTEVVAVLGMHSGVEQAIGLFAARPSPSRGVPDAADAVATGPGFWLALAVLVVVAAVATGSLLRRWSAAMEEELRTPGKDL